MQYSTPSYFVQLPAGGTTNYSPNANAADHPFQPAVAFTLIGSTLLAFVALWLSNSRSRRF